MTHHPHSRQTRRQFLANTAAATAAVATGGILGTDASPRPAADAVVLVLDTTDPLTLEPPVQWAARQLHQALVARGLEVLVQADLLPPPRRQECILVAGQHSSLARPILDAANVPMPAVSEALALVRGRARGNAVLAACGADARGLVYALLELADRVTFAADPLAELRRVPRTVEQPANSIRSMARLFVSDVEDKPWFNDRAFWQRYLTELATHRFNRFSLTLGLGYDFPIGIRDCYFHFAYPFLVSVPGYHVRAVPLAESEREGNLEMLRFIGEESVRRGLHFQLGLWTHAYRWTRSPHANYRIEGLAPESHAAYCRDALQALLQTCPTIGGVTFRIHGESGVPEGSYDFWRTVFDGIVRCGRRVEIDLHAKGIDQAMIDVALATGMPVNVSPKFWAEHMGLPYMQGAIRPLEMPPRNAKDGGFFAKSSGSRRFLRYGYGDLLAENRRYGVLHRIWPGTQRLLLWGDPEMASGYGRVSSFCGSLGVEWCEPLSFKGRKGSGLPGSRTAYADRQLQPADGDFAKYAYTYRVWGRCIFNPQCDATVWQRRLRNQFGPGSEKVELALRYASRILPLVTTAHCPSAANNNYWPELYTNMPIVDANRPHPYGDTISPKRLGTVSPLDPEFFSGIDEFADQLLRAEGSSTGAKYSPAWVAEQLTTAAGVAEGALRLARRTVRDPNSADFRRLTLDVVIQAGLGYFFAWKFRAGVLLALYSRSNDPRALEAALKAHHTARAAWQKMAEQARGDYVRDITFGYDRHLRGHWLDRLAAIDEDIGDMEKLLAQTGDATMASPSSAVARAIQQVLNAPPQPERAIAARFNHVPPDRFTRNQPLLIEAGFAPRPDDLRLVRLRYRRVNQAELWQGRDMEPTGDGYRATIPATCTDSVFPLQYHFELHAASETAWLYPGLRPGWHGQPYFVVRQVGA
ncbi:MAG: twin-arginine translocation signal domain-containing protein [Verrucomicrobia bacterium]|nr:twin-arginine translocation signal domain-containing protein [Verrucomicrobiota bacterium]